MSARGGGRWLRNLLVSGFRNFLQDGAAEKRRSYRGQGQIPGWGLRFVFLPPFIFNRILRFVFRFVLGSFFPLVRVFNSFSASFLGSFGFVFGARCCVFNNFSGSFFKKRVFCPTIIMPKPQDVCFQRLANILKVNSDCLLLRPHRLPYHSKDYYARPHMSSKICGIPRCRQCHP